MKGTPSEFYNKGYKAAIQKAIELIGEDSNLYARERTLGKYDWRVERETGENELRFLLRQALEAELDSNSMKIEGIKKESNQ